jgi:hypothetical protein
MKKLTKVLFLLGVILLFTNVAKVVACEIEFEVVDNQKEVYNVGDEFVVLVKVSFTHRVCPIDIKNTKFDTKGLKILKGTPWKELSAGVWERKLKVQVQETKKGKLLLTATRTCDKKGGFGEITLHSSI